MAPPVSLIEEQKTPERTPQSSPMSDFFSDTLVVNVVNYRFGSKTFSGAFTFRRLNIHDEHVVDVAVAASTNGLPWDSFSAAARESMVATATVGKALTDVPEWYNYKGKECVVTDGLIVRLFREYDAWVALSFRGVPSDSEGSGGESGMEVHSVVRDLERRLSEGRGPAGSPA